MNATWRLPQLERLIFRPESSTLPRFSQFAGHIKMLTCNMFSSSSSLQQLFDCYPQMEELCTGFDSKSAWAHLSGSLPSLQRIGISVEGDIVRYYEDIAHTEVVLEAFSNRETFPSLNAVFLMETIRLTEDITGQAWWRRCEDRLKSAGRQLVYMRCDH
jgi:hypothetical protein